MASSRLSDILLARNLRGRKPFLADPSQHTEHHPHLPSRQGDLLAIHAKLLLIFSVMQGVLFKSTSPDVDKGG